MTIIEKEHWKLYNNDKDTKEENVCERMNAELH